MHPGISVGDVDEGSGEGNEGRTRFSGNWVGFGN